jgi:hypothetical protein
MTAKPSKARLADLRKSGAKTASPEEVAALVKAGHAKATSLTWATASPNTAALRVVAAAEQHTVIGKTGNGQVGGWDGLSEQLEDLAKQLRQNDLTGVEDMLMGQAVALQAMFVRLTEGAMVAENVTNYDLKLRYALRAQSQCRATLETLAAIKNPPVIFARQVNATTGPQQINNSGPRARENESGRNEQSDGAAHELCQDGGTPALAVGNDSPLAPVGEIDRAPDAGGKGAVVPERMEGRPAGLAAGAGKAPARAKAIVEPLTAHPIETASHGTEAMTDGR